MDHQHYSNDLQIRRMKHLGKSQNHNARHKLWQALWLRIEEKI